MHGRLERALVGQCLLPEAFMACTHLNEEADHAYTRTEFFWPLHMWPVYPPIREAPQGKEPSTHTPGAAGWRTDDGLRSTASAPTDCSSDVCPGKAPPPIVTGLTHDRRHLGWSRVWRLSVLGWFPERFQLVSQCKSASSLGRMLC